MPLIKSWGKNSAVTLFDTRQINIPARLQLHLLSPSSHSTDRVESVYGVAFSVAPFNIVLDGEGGGGKDRWMDWGGGKGGGS